MTGGEVLLVLTPALPVTLAFLWGWAGLRRHLAPLVPWAPLPGLVLALAPIPDGASWSHVAVMTGLRLGLDDTARAFLLLVALLWLVVGLFARSYHRDDREKDRFFGFFLLTMTGNLGLVVAADVVSFYLFFACMTFAAYGLVVHQRDAAAFRAGRVYLVLAVLGEIGVLGSLFLLGSVFGGVPAFGPEITTAWTALEMDGRSGWVGVLVVAGFGIKAGLVPLHLWLPLAHPVAPTPASALLSGAMIKGGLLAWIRHLPPETGLPAAGMALIMLGAVATLYGVVVGLTQDDPKTVLAYSSVSQMGFMAVGMGLVARTTNPGRLGLLAVAAYALHHGVAKGALFLSVGVADHVPIEASSPSANVNRAGSRSAWMILLGAGLPALALSGAPFSSGALSKGVLKYAIEDLAPDLYPILDPVLLLAGIGTTLIMARFLLLLRRRIDRRRDEEDLASGPVPSQAWPSGMMTPWLVLLGAVLIGPGWLPHVLPGTREGLLPGVLSDWSGAAWPVLAGAAVAWLVAVRPTLIGNLRTIRIPPGDLLLPVERMIRRIGPIPLETWIEGSGRWLGRHFRAVQVRAHAWAALLAEEDLRMARGWVIAPLFMLLILGLLALLV